MSPVDYEEVNSFNNSVQDLKSKYIVLKPQTSSSSAAATTAATATTTTANTFGCNASATITSSSTNTNGKILVNGTSADKSNNLTGNFDPNNYDFCAEHFVVVVVVAFFMVLLLRGFSFLIDLASVLCRVLSIDSPYIVTFCAAILERQDE